MPMKRNKLILILILLLAAFLRFYRLTSYPPLNVDEAAIGYNAWSLIKTGKDEHGHPWPLHFKSFGDYKPGGYFYLVLPLVKFLGLREEAVRWPSAFLGVATILLVYLLAQKLWRDETLALIWAFVLSISPWQIHFSRGGWESNAALFWLTLGVYLFFSKITSVRQSKIPWFGVGLPFILALYTYHSARIIVPVFLLGLLVFHGRLLWRQKRKLFFPLFLSLLFILPLIISFWRGGASARFAGVGLLADPGPLWRVNELLGHHQRRSFLVRLLHNRPLIYGLAFLQKYFSHFDGRFLFIDGDEVPRSKVPEMGLMHFFEAPLLFLGLWFWLRKKRPFCYLPFLWLLVAPLASAMTFQAPSALRALPLVVPLTFFVAQGIKGSLKFSFLKKIPGGKFGLGLILFFIYLWGTAYWWQQYFVHYLQRYPSAWPDFRPLAQWLKNHQHQYEKICLEGNFDQPYILTLFYLRYPPEKIQSEIKLTPPDKFGFSTVKHFGKYYFADCQQLKNVKIVRP